MKSGQRVYVDVYARRRSGLRDGGRVVVRPGGGMHEWPKPVRSYADSGEPAAHRGHSLALGKLSEWVQTLVRREMLAQSTDGPMLVISGAPTHWWHRQSALIEHLEQILRLELHFADFLVQDAVARLLNCYSA